MRGLLLFSLALLPASAQAHWPVGAVDALLPGATLAFLSLVVVFGAALQQRRAQREQRSFKELFDQNRLVLQSVNEGIFGLDLQGRCTFVNDAACRMFGYRREEMLGADMHLLTHHTKLDGQPFPKTDCPSSHAMHQGRVTRVAEDNFWDRNGQPFLVSYSTTPLADQGEILGAVTVFRDLTKEKEAQRRIAEQSATIEGLFIGSAAMMGVCEAVGQDLKLLTLNPATRDFFGLGERAVEGHVASELGARQRHLKLWRAQFEQARAAGRPQRYAYRHVQGRHRSRWLEVDVFYIGPGAEGPRYTFVALDQTDAKEKEVQLIKAKQDAQRAAQIKADFLANVSHEIRTPLNSVLVFAQLLSEKGLNEDQRALIQPIRSAGKNLLTLINDLLDLRKLEGGHLSLQLEAFDLCALVEEVAQVFSLPVQQKGLTLRLKQPETPPPKVWLDEDRMRQILTNLLGNAAKFSDQGEIELALSWEPVDPEHVSLCLQCSDQGPGLAPSQMESLFEPFIQGEQGRRDGSGLGLAISQQFAQLMGGKITAENRPQGGARFQLQFPRVRRLAEHTPAPPRPTESSEASPPQPPWALEGALSQWDQARWQAAVAPVFKGLAQVQQDGLVSSYQVLSTALERLAEQAGHPSLAQSAHRLRKAIERFDIAAMREEAQLLGPRLEQLQARIPES